MRYSLPSLRVTRPLRTKAIDFLVKVCYYYIDFCYGWGNKIVLWESEVENIAFLLLAINFLISWSNASCIGRYWSESKEVDGDLIARFEQLSSAQGFVHSLVLCYNQLVDFYPWDLLATFEVKLQSSNVLISKDRGALLLLFEQANPEVGVSSRLRRALNQAAPTITVKPIWLAFVRSGYVNVNNGNVNNVGNEATLRSRTSVSTTNAYILNSNPTTVNPSNSAVRYNGRPLRCRLCPCGADLLATKKPHYGVNFSWCPERELTWTL